MGHDWSISLFRITVKMQYLAPRTQYMDQKLFKTQISAQPTTFFQYMRACWDSRHSLGTLVRRQFKIKYANTVIGLAWALIQPLMYLVLLVLVFVKIADIEVNGGHPYAFTAVGLIVWVYISSIIQGSLSVAMASQDIMGKVYFPRIFIPLAVAIESFVDLAVAFLLALILGGISFGVHLIALPFALLCLLLTGFWISIWVFMSVILFPDFRFVIGFLLRLLIFVTPIAYASSLLVEQLGFWYIANPLNGLIDWMRYSLSDMDFPAGYQYIGLISLPILLLATWTVFKKFDHKIGDIL